MHIKWVKAHVGTAGNETADSLAKRGTTLGEGTIQGIHPAYNKQRKNIDEHYQKIWESDWKNYKEARQTKIFFPKTNEKKSQQLLTMKRAKLGRLVQLFTGHNQLKRHKNIQEGITEPDSCRLCREEEESSFHVIVECPALNNTRLAIFHNQTIQESELAKGNWEISQVTEFLRRTKIGEMLEGAEID